MQFKRFSQTFQIPDVADICMGTYRETLQEGMNHSSSTRSIPWPIPRHCWAEDVQLDTHLREYSTRFFNQSGSFDAWIYAISQGTYLESIQHEVTQDPKIITVENKHGITVVDALLQFISNNAPIWKSTHISPFEKAEKNRCIRLLNLCFDQDLLWEEEYNSKKSAWATQVLELPSDLQSSIKLNFLIRVLHHPHQPDTTFTIGEEIDHDLETEPFFEFELDTTNELSDDEEMVSIELSSPSSNNSPVQIPMSPISDGSINLEDQHWLAFDH